MTQPTIPRKYTRLRDRVQKVEEKIAAIYGDKEIPRFISLDSHRERTRVMRLIKQKQKLLDKMFAATPEEVERMEQVSNKLLDLTQKMYARTREIYQKTIVSNYDPEFDNDVDIESFIRFDMNGEDSVLPMNNDDYYGSNFQEMFFIISLLSHNPWDEYIEECSFSTTPSKHIPDMSEYKDDLNDDQSWYHDSMPAADNLSHLCICHAIYDLNMHKPYSIPDILRMNDFTVEVAVKHQHFANQFGRTNI